LGLRQIGVDAHLYYASNTHVASQPEWEAGEVDESKVGNESHPNLEAFKYTRPNWMHPILTETGHSILFARNLVSEFNGFDVIIGHWPFARFCAILRNDGMITKPYIIYEAGMLRQLDNPMHQERDALRGYMDAALIIYANVDMLPLLQLFHLEKYAQYAPLPIDTSRYIPPKKRDNDHLVFLCPTRHSWAEKGNDMLIAAFAEYVKRNPAAELRLCGWGGEDLQGSKMMIYQRNLGGNVTWLPMLGKKHLIGEYQKADAVFDQFIYGATGSTGPEAMSCELPLVSHITPEFFMRHHGSIPPILDAFGPEQIYEHMIKLEDEGYRKQLGEDGRKWVQEQQDILVVARRQRDLCQTVIDAFK